MAGAPPNPPAPLLGRLDALAAELRRHADALALLALGSVGRETGRLDAWSDLDFFVLVRDGAKSRFIGNLDWLAAAHPLAWHFRNTADGHKALMTDGVFCEFAVFELHELPRIPYAPGRFVWRRDEVPQSLQDPTLPPSSARATSWLVDEALANLIVGLQRHARGETLAAMRMIQVHALDRVLEVLEVVQGAEPVDAAPASGGPAARDPFNVDRRVERRHPALAAALPGWAAGYDGTRTAALGLLAALEAAATVPLAPAARIRALAQGAA